MTAPLPTYLISESATTIFDRVALKMRLAGYPLNDGTPEAMLATSFSEVLFDDGATLAARIYSDMFIRTASDPALDEHGLHLGVPRLEPTVAVVDVTFTGVPGTIVPLGTIVSTAGIVGVPAVAFSTDADATIGGGGTVTTSATAVLTGAAGNVGINTIRFLANGVAGVDSVANAAAAIEGTDLEETEHYRARLLAVAGEDAGMASVGDYERLIDEIPDVGFRLVEPLWASYGSIRVVILDDDGNIPSGTLVSLVQQTLDPVATPGDGYGEGSIAHIVTVVAPTNLPLVVNVPALVPEAGVTLPAAKAAGEAAVNAYVQATNPGGKIRIRDAEAVYIQATGVENIGDLTINGSRADVALTTTQKASATFTYVG